MTNENCNVSHAKSNNRKLVSAPFKWTDSITSRHKKHQELSNYSWLPITRTLANSNQNRFPLDFRHTFTVIWPSVTRSSFCFPSDHFYIILPSITRTMFWALKKSKKKPSTGVRNIEFWISIDVLWEYSLLVEANVDCHRLTWSSFSSQDSKTHPLFRLCFDALRLIYNLKVSFNFHVTFLQLNVIKMFSVQ